MTPKDSKRLLRSKVLSQRPFLRKEEKKSLSLNVFEQILTLGLLGSVHSISVYLAIKNEVQTKMLIDKLMIFGKRIFLPCSSGGNRGNLKEERASYDFAEFRNWQDLELGPFGILQPISSVSKQRFSEASKSETEIDLAVIPGVAFDRDGVRLGRGRGIYDVLLSKSKAIKIGLAFDSQIVRKIPKEKHDLIMDYVVTDKRVIKSSMGRFS